MAHGSSCVAAAAPPPARWPARSTYPTAASGRVEMGAAPPFSRPHDVGFHAPGTSADTFHAGFHRSGGASHVAAGAASTRLEGERGSGGGAAAATRPVAAGTSSSGLYAGWLTDS
jgi:hypothetical protein